MLHVGKPFPDKKAEGSLNVAYQVFEVGSGQIFQAFSCFKLFGQVADGQEQVGKSIMFEKIRVLQKAQHKIAFFEKEFSQIFQLHVVWVELPLIALDESRRGFIMGSFPIQRNSKGLLQC